uniref:Uncharacterized protein n=1 Tax=Cannabis sativa TaxID=3483 RepID=A0A803QH43_CANSA
MLGVCLPALGDTCLKRNGSPPCRLAPPGDEHMSSDTIALEQWHSCIISSRGTQKLTFQTMYDLIHCAVTEGFIGIWMVFHTVAKSVDSSGVGFVICKSLSQILAMRTNNPPMIYIGKTNYEYVPLSSCLSPIPVNNKGKWLEWAFALANRLTSRPVSLSNFIAALVISLVWVLNVVPIDMARPLSIIYERLIRSA